jgi:RNA polymerase sigma factor (TIGR02999 family)
VRLPLGPRASGAFIWGSESLSSNETQITSLLNSISGGDSDALSALFAVLYSELRVLARRQLAGHRRGTLSTTVVVHEAYLKLLSGQDVDLDNRMHFFSLAARAMRQILIDYARMRPAEKRGGDQIRVTLGENDAVTEARAEELLDLDQALERLAECDERLGKVVNLRFFAGLSVEETAELMAMSPRTVKREWRKARAFLHCEINTLELSASAI